MKSKYLIPVIVLVTITLTSAQQNKTSVTKEETQEWISEKIRQYSNGQTNRYGISFKDENMFIEQNTSKYFHQTVPGDTGASWNKARSNKINRIDFIFRQ